MMFSNSYWLNLKTSAQCTFPFFLSLVPFKLLNVILFSNKFYPHFNKFVKCQLNIRIRVVYYLFLCSEISRKKLTHYSNMRTKTPLQPLLNGNVIHTEWLPIGGTAFFGRRFDIWLRNSTMLVNSRNDKGVFCGLARQWFLKCCIAINGHWTIYFITETFAIVRYGGSMKVGSEKRKLKQPI